MRSLKAETIGASAGHVAAPRAALAAGRRASAYTFLIATAIFLLALAPRALAQGRFVTVDEAYHWFERAQLFLQAVRGGDWSGTNLVGHPGVTTMWLGALGVIVHQALASWGLASWPDPELLRVLLRLPVAIVTALCIAASYPLLRRLLGARVALLAALLWAGDPFMVAHSQLLHVDALLASFITVSLLAATLAFRRDQDSEGGLPRWRMLILSAIAGGLALLTKSPAIILLAAIGLIALAGSVRSPLSVVGSKVPGARSRSPCLLVSLSPWRSSVVGRWSSVVLPLLAWVVIAAAVWVALWPAAWVDPAGAVGSIVHQAEADGGSPHAWGNFFLGQAVADPGPLFYPLAAALRLPPWSLIGLIAAPAALLSRRPATMGERRPLLLLALFALLFTLMMSIAAKKFDRYILPIFPSLDIIAAAGLVWLGDWVWAFWHKRTTEPRTENQEPRTKNPEPRTKNQQDKETRRQGDRNGSMLLVSWSPGLLVCQLSLVVLVLGANLAWYHPYELAYYNPLLGGGPAAARLIPVGWGEGLEQAGAYIQAQPDGADRPVATWYRPALKPYISAPLVPLSWALEPGKVGYAVLYIDQVQRHDEAQATDMLRARFTPIYTVRIHGIAYAEVYQLPQAVAQPREADFGPAIHFRGYDLDTATAAQGFLTLTVHWQARGPIADDYMLFVHVLDGAAARVGGVDVPPAGGREPTSAWRPGGYVSAVLRVPIEAGAAARARWIAIGLYDPRTGARLGLRADPQPLAPDDGQDALLIGPVSIR